MCELLLCRCGFGDGLDPRARYTRDDGDGYGEGAGLGYGDGYGYGEGADPEGNSGDGYGDWPGDGLGAGHGAYDRGDHGQDSVWSTAHGFALQGDRGALPPGLERELWTAPGARAVALDLARERGLRTLAEVLLRADRAQHTLPEHYSKK